MSPGDLTPEQALNALTASARRLSANRAGLMAMAATPEGRAATEAYLQTLDAWLGAMEPAVADLKTLRGQMRRALRKTKILGIAA